MHSVKLLMSAHSISAKLRKTRATCRTSDPEEGVFAGVDLSQISCHILPHPVERLVHDGRRAGREQQ